MTSYAEKIIELVAEVEAMEKDPDAYNDTDTDEMKVKIKQAEAQIKQLKLSINTSTAVFQALHVQVSPVDGKNYIRCNMDTICWKKRNVFFLSSPLQGRLWTGWKGLATKTRSWRRVGSS